MPRGPPTGTASGSRCLQNSLENSRKPAVRVADLCWRGSVCRVLNAEADVLQLRCFLRSLGSVAGTVRNFEHLVADWQLPFCHLAWSRLGSAVVP